MVFTSYAQNFEDVMLWRALKHVSNGCYIDIGAQHPIVDSVSKGFYEQGWRGIHIEPVPHYVELLKRDRPDETILPIAISEQSGVIDMHQILDTGLSTVSLSQAEEHRDKHGFQFQTISVPTMPLREALRPLERQEIHWLKIDVEGFEQQVLRTWDSQATRPWIMLIEATAPMSQVSTHEAWEPIVLHAGYRFVYFDGLNRFYVAEEHASLATAFNVPPNVFDNVRLSGTSGNWCATLAGQLHEAQNDLRAQSARIEELEAQQQQFAHNESILNHRLQQAEQTHRLAQAEWVKTEETIRQALAEERRSRGNTST